jgi:hypothetical protein
MGWTWCSIQRAAAELPISTPPRVRASLNRGRRQLHSVRMSIHHLQNQGHRCLETANGSISDPLAQTREPTVAATYLSQRGSATRKRSDRKVRLAKTSGRTRHQSPLRPGLRRCSPSTAMCRTPLFEIELLFIQFIAKTAPSAERQALRADLVPTAVAVG